MRTARIEQLTVRVYDWELDVKCVITEAERSPDHFSPAAVDLISVEVISGGTIEEYYDEFHSEESASEVIREKILEQV